MHFRYFVITFPWKRTGPFIWTKLNPLHHARMLCAKFGWNWPGCSGEEDFEIHQCISPYFAIISPWKRIWPFICTNLNPLQHARMLCAKFGRNWPSGSGEEDFLNSSMYFLYFVIVSPWGKTWPFIWSNLNPLHPRILCAKFGWNWPSGSEEEENVKSLQWRRTTDKLWSEKLTWAFGSGELKNDLLISLKLCST